MMMAKQKMMMGFGACRLCYLSEVVMVVVVVVVVVVVIVVVAMG